MAELDADLVDYMHWATQLRGLSDNTMRVRVDVLYRLNRYLTVPMRAATADHLLAFEKVAIAGRSAETRHAYACHVRALYRWLVASGRRSDDPSLVLTLPLLPRRLPRPIDEQDLALAIGTARPKLAAMLALESYAGLRCCETAGFEWSDLHRQVGREPFIHVRRGKGSRERTVEIGRYLIDVLAAYGVRRRGPAFLGNDGAQIDANSVSRAINRHLRDLGIDATAHQLRHRYGTVAYELSKDLRMVQEQMGHASADTTVIYTRPSRESARRMVSQMDALAPSSSSLPIPRAVSDHGGARQAPARPSPLPPVADRAGQTIPERKPA